MTEKIQGLTDLQRKAKFSKKEWKERGLNPSGRKIIKLLTENIDSLLNDLKKCIESSSNSAIKKIFNTKLNDLEKQYLDTEEREFITDYYFEIASIVDVDINKELGLYLYGFDTSAPMQKKVSTIIENQLYHCTNCKVELSVDVTMKNNKVPGIWMIVQCDNCNGFNMIALSKGVERFIKGKYFIFEKLFMDKVAESQALERLNEIIEINK